MSHADTRTQNNDWFEHMDGPLYSGGPVNPPFSEDQSISTGKKSQTEGVDRWARPGEEASRGWSQLCLDSSGKLFRGMLRKTLAYII